MIVILAAAAEATLAPPLGHRPRRPALGGRRLVDLGPRSVRLHRRHVRSDRMLPGLGAPRPGARGLAGAHGGPRRGCLRGRSRSVRRCDPGRLRPPARLGPLLRLPERVPVRAGGRHHLRLLALVRRPSRGRRVPRLGGGIRARDSPPTRPGRHPAGRSGLALRDHRVRNRSVHVLRQQVGRSHPALRLAPGPDGRHLVAEPVAARRIGRIPLAALGGAGVRVARWRSCWSPLRGRRSVPRSRGRRWLTPFPAASRFTGPSTASGTRCRSTGGRRTARPCSTATCRARTAFRSSFSRTSRPRS